MLKEIPHHLCTKPHLINNLIMQYLRIIYNIFVSNLKWQDKKINLIQDSLLYFFYMWNMRIETLFECALPFKPWARASIHFVLMMYNLSTPTLHTLLLLIILISLWYLFFLLLPQDNECIFIFVLLNVILIFYMLLYCRTLY